MADPILLQRVIRYAELSGFQIDLETPIGGGTDGTIWQSNRRTAIKALILEKSYALELLSYQRLMEYGVKRLGIFAVPQLVGFNDELMVIELTIVSPPYVLDFAKVYIDFPPQHSEEVVRETESQWRELFEDRWSEVRALLHDLESFGIYYQDPKPGNIMFPNWP